MKYLAMTLALVAALAVTNSIVGAQEAEEVLPEKPAVVDDTGGNDGDCTPRFGQSDDQRGCCNARRGMRRGGENQQARRNRGGGKNQQARRNRGGGKNQQARRRRGVGRGGRGLCGGRGAGVDAKPVGPVEPATPEYLKRLQTALESELYARDYYTAAATALPGERRFSNLARAESNHAAAITSAITLLGGKPVQQQKVAIVVPKTVDEADAHCTEIELHVIEMYKGLIKDCPDAGVTRKLKRIQAANYRHLQVVSG